MSDFFLLPDLIPHGITEEAMDWFTVGDLNQDLAQGIWPFNDGSTGGQAVGSPAPAPLPAPSPQQDDELLRICNMTAPSVYLSTRWT